MHRLAFLNSNDKRLDNEHHPHGVNSLSPRATGSENMQQACCLFISFR